MMYLLLLFALVDIYKKNNKNRIKNKIIKISKINKNKFYFNKMIFRSSYNSNSKN